jgi:2-oxoisovalerate dehydrogenase E1 component
VYGTSEVLTIITYGNGLYLSLQAKKEIEKKTRKKIKVIDLRWLAPINYEDLISNIEKCKNILIVDECRKTGCHGEGILTDLLCGLNGKSKIVLHAAKDSFIPLGVSATSTLPSRKSIVQKAIDLING